MRDFGLNPEQMKAVEDRDGAILVIAGAGSGKTRVLTARICALVEAGVSPYNILAITFTNKAANEMKERIQRELGGSGYDVWTSTFHSMCARMLRMDGERLGYSRDFTIYTELESERVVKRVADEVQGADPKRRGSYVNHISRAKTAALKPDEYYEAIKDDVTDARAVALVYAAYERELKKSNAMDFDDLLVKTVELFETCPDVLERWQNRFRYINVDEFQDTNRLQLRLVSLLAAKWGNVFVVGDEDQSIYSWRGAEIRNILEFPETFKGAKVYKLEQNYRSTKNILEAANNVIKHNNARNEKTLWSALGKGYDVRYYEARTDRDEADYVTRAIGSLLTEGENYRDTAVLVRANALTRLFEESFTLHGIPYKVFGGFRFFERKEIKDTLGYVRLAINPNDNDAFLRVVNYPRRGIGPSAVAEVAMVSARLGVSYLAAAKHAESLSPASARKLAAFAAVADKIAEGIGEMKPVDFMQYVIKESGLENTLKLSDDPEDRNRYDNIEGLVAAVQNFVDDNPEATISDFMQSVSLVSDTDEMDGENYVTLATVHAVKGLEFDNVFVVGLEDGIFPTSTAVTNGDIEEERRLMYVAITRAKQRLTVSWARSRFRFGKVETFPKSRFISEMQGEKASIRMRAAFPSSEQRTPSPARKPSLDGIGRGMSGFVSVPQRNADAPDFSEFEKGVVVEHKRFGKGVVRETVGEGENKTAAIEFEGLGVKRFALAIAINSLKIVKE